MVIAIVLFVLAGFAYAIHPVLAVVVGCFGIAFLWEEVVG